MPYTDTPSGSFTVEPIDSELEFYRSAMRNARQQGTVDNKQAERFWLRVAEVHRRRYNDFRSRDPYCNNPKYSELPKPWGEHDTVFSRG
jgi:hypothetical protein